MINIPRESETNKFEEKSATTLFKYKHMFMKDIFLDVK
jgi:hypothetical protein